MIKFTILGEPASKANSRRLVTFGKRPAFIKSEKALAFERAAELQIPHDARVMLTCDVRATLKIYYASERPDLDESVVLDVLQAKYERIKGKLEKIDDDTYGRSVGERKLVSRGVYLNDRQVREKHVFHFIDRKNPRVEIEIEPMQPTMFEDDPIPVPAPQPKRERVTLKGLLQRKAQREGVPF